MKRDNCINLASTNTCPNDRKELSHVTRRLNFQVCFLEKILNGYQCILKLETYDQTGIALSTL